MPRERSRSLSFPAFSFIAHRQRLEHIERLEEAKALYLSEEADHITMGTAAETIESPRLRIDGQGRHLVLMKRTVADKGSPGVFEVDVATDHRFDGSGLLQTLDPLSQWRVGLPRGTFPRLFW